MKTLLTLTLGIGIGVGATLSVKLLKKEPPTNEQCIAEIMETLKDEANNMSREDKDYATVGASMLCQSSQNDAKLALKKMKEMH